MAFTFVQGPHRYHTVGCLGSASMVNGGTVRFDAGTGYIEPSVETAVTHYGVCVSATQTASATNGATKVQVIPFMDGQIWEVDTTGTLTQAMVGTICALESATAIDEDEVSTRPCFEIVEYVSASKARVTPVRRLITAIGV